jgi:hypothetical protein
MKVNTQKAKLCYYTLAGYHGTESSVLEAAVFVRLEFQPGLGGWKR